MLARLSASLLPREADGRAPAHAGSAALLRGRLADLSARIAQDQLFYQAFSFGRFDSGLSVAPPGRSRQARRRWAALTVKVHADAVRRHYAAWIIQSAWRATAGKLPGFTPNLRQYFGLELEDFQRAECRAMRSLADKVLGETLQGVIGLGRGAEGEDAS